MSLQSDDPDIYACGWRLRTGLPIGGALIWPASRADPPDVMVVAGDVGGLENPVVELDLLHIAADGTALAGCEGIGYFLLTGDRVVYELQTAPSAPEVGAFFFGNILACICWRRRQLALHGSAVSIDGRAVLLLGRAATGKSVLAAALVQRGHIALADEVVAVRDAMCFPTGGPLHLADDALAALGIDGSSLRQYRNFALPKRPWSAGPRPEPRPYPIAAVLCLSKAEPDAPIAMRPLAGDEAVAAILDQVYWRDMLKVLDSRADAHREASALAASAVVYACPVPRGLVRIDAVADNIARSVSA